jgi:hypothetical protein
MRPLLSVALVALSAQLMSSAAAQSRYDNPVDKKTYITPGQFKTYQPAVPRDDRGQRVTTQDIRLLTGEPDLKARVKVEDLAAFVKAAEVRAYAELARNKSAMEALVQFNCKPTKCEVELASQGKADKAILQALHDALTKLPPLKTTGEIIFQVRFSVGT